MPDFPLRQLRSLLAPAARSAGVVTRLRGAAVEVATADGLIVAQPGAAGLIVGQAVTVQNGIAWPRAVASMAYAL